MSFETISVVGLGYIGLPTAAMFASRKKKVIGVDVNKDVVDTINHGKIHIVEPELDIIVSATVSEGYLKATTAAEPADAFLIAVPTPFQNAAKEAVPVPDLSYIKAAAKLIAPVLQKGNLVILESTSPVGTTESLARWLAAERPDLSFPQNAGSHADINIAHCPERVLPGHVVRELVENDRVIGGMTPRCAERAEELYKIFVKNECILKIFVKNECILTNSRMAEMVKLTENSSRDVQIAFANELSLICDQLDIDVWELITLANRHPRVNILQPGPGVGGHCIAVDPWFIVAKTPEQARLIHTAREINDGKPHWVVNRVLAAVQRFSREFPQKDKAEITIACYGLTFKPDIDDLRESPAFEIVKQISTEHCGKVLAVEPNIEKLPTPLKGVELVDFITASELADIQVLLVDHKVFKAVRPVKGIIVDTRGIWR